jgi:SAM-dependent methyltransferase
MDGAEGAPPDPERPQPSFDRAFWDERWSEVLRRGAAQVAQRPASAYLTEVAEDLPAGRALDAGSGHGAETLWLAARGWEVTAVDFSAPALDHARSMAATLGPDIAARVDWVEADLGTWAPGAELYNLVVSLYVHVAGPVEDMVSRLAGGVAMGGTLLLVGHLPVDPVTGAATPAAGQVQVTVDAAAAVLHPERWELRVAENRQRAAAGSGFDAVVCAQRRD